MKWTSNFLKALKYVTISLLVLFSFYSLSSDRQNDPRNCADCEKAYQMSATELGHKCKSEWSSEGCTEAEKLILLQKITDACGEVPKVSQWNRYLFVSYLQIPMLNIAFVSHWSHTYSDISWPTCVVCLLNYPMDPYWEVAYRPSCGNFTHFAQSQSPVFEEGDNEENLYSESQESLTQKKNRGVFSSDENPALTSLP